MASVYFVATLDG